MFDGILNVYKPTNISSSDVVLAIKKILKIKKVGHTGTLDPLACGVLPICIGNATKLSEYFINKDKTYKVKLKFGILTDTYDLESDIIKRDDKFKINRDSLLNTLKDFEGDYEQVPPLHSAVSINGTKAYKLARQGINFKIESRIVKVYYINEIEIENDTECSFLVKCSKGTYIRSLCKDIGDRLNTYATMTFLERVKSGDFSKENAINFEDLTFDKIADNIIPIHKTMSIPSLEINDCNLYKLLTNGVNVKNPKYLNGIEKGKYFVFYKDKLIGICQREVNFLKIIKFFN